MSTRWSRNLLGAGAAGSHRLMSAHLPCLLAQLQLHFAPLVIVCIPLQEGWPALSCYGGLHAPNLQQGSSVWSAPMICSKSSPRRA